MAKKKEEAKETEVKAEVKAEAKGKKGKGKKAADKRLKVAAIRFSEDCEDGVRYVYFRLADVAGVMEDDLAKLTVSLSRVPGKCIYAVNRMHEHDSHAPPFYTGNAGEGDENFNKFGGEKAADAYMERVFTELKTKATEVLPGVEIEFEKTGWTDKHPAVPGESADADADPDGG